MATFANYWLLSNFATVAYIPGLVIWETDCPLKIYIVLPQERGQPLG